jgi:hypothetical protein
MPMTSKESRELLLSTLQSLRGLCRAIAQESKHFQSGCAWKGKQYTVTWQLSFDDAVLEFEPICMVMPGVSPPRVEPPDLSAEANGLPDSALLELEARIQSKLEQLKAGEEWPASLPVEWLEP